MSYIDFALSAQCKGSVLLYNCTQCPVPNYTVALSAQSPVHCQCLTKPRHSSAQCQPVSHRNGRKSSKTKVEMGTNVVKQVRTRLLQHVITVWGLPVTI